ncbi:MAG TPA: hypothetical protein VLQ93_03940 [Myxococcaceae bacterium]|nr:hypothetical protein [Myxococcaceae bacterium]
MSRTIPLLAAGGLAAALIACPTRTPSPPDPTTAASPVRVPPGCEANLAGEYHHAENPAFRYLGEDDGDTLSLAVARAREGEETPRDAGTVRIILERTPEGFVGQTRATTFTPSGEPCPVHFPTEVVACDDAGLTLRSVAATALDEDCRPAPQEGRQVWREQRLVRGAPDAGTPD